MPLFQSSNAREKNNDIVNEIVSRLSSSCGCGFTSDLLTDSVFLCSSSSSNSVTYQTQLHGTPQANASQLIKIVEEKIFKKGISIKVQFSLLFIENTCIVPYGSERPCEDVSSTSTEIVVNTSSSNVGIFTGTIITLVVIIIVMGIALVALIWKIVQAKRKQTQHL